MDDLSVEETLEEEEDGALSLSVPGKGVSKAQTTDRDLHVHQSIVFSPTWGVPVL